VLDRVPMAQRVSLTQGLAMVLAAEALLDVIYASDSPGNRSTAAGFTYLAPALGSLPRRAVEGRSWGLR
jgi:hypothetical protein